MQWWNDPESAVGRSGGAIHLVWNVKQHSLARNFSQQSKKHASIQAQMNFQRRHNWSCSVHSEIYGGKNHNSVQQWWKEKLVTLMLAQYNLTLLCKIWFAFGFYLTATTRGKLSESCLVLTGLSWRCTGTRNNVIDIFY